MRDIQSMYRVCIEHLVNSLSHGSSPRADPCRDAPPPRRCAVRGVPVARRSPRGATRARTRRGGQQISCRSRVCIETCSCFTDVQLEPSLSSESDLETANPQKSISKRTGRWRTMRTKKINKKTCAFCHKASLMFIVDGKSMNIPTRTWGLTTHLLICSLWVPHLLIFPGQLSSQETDAKQGLALSTEYMDLPK